MKWIAGRGLFPSGSGFTLIKTSSLFVVCCFEWAVSAPLAQSQPPTVTAMPVGSGYSVAVPNPTVLSAESVADPSADPMLAYLQSRVAADPGHAESWRLIGKLELKRGNATAAMAALNHALELAPSDAAVHFDLGELLETSGDQAAADEQFRLVGLLAPQSQYTKTLIASGKIAAPPNEDANFLQSDGMIEQVRFEIQTFDGSDDLEERFHELEAEAAIIPKSLRASVELGGLYNSNVTLTPISRELINSDASSFQAFASPDLEWIAKRGEAWRVGTVARGYFTINDSEFSSFNLASFQPGAFYERDFTYGENEWIAKVEYLYSFDMLGGTRFGDRHGLTASLIVIRPDLDVIYGYMNTSFSQFDDDGDDPSVTSLDGPATTIGISRFFQTGMERLPTYSLGVDASTANTEGADFRYNAINAFTDTAITINEFWSFVPSAGVGFRDYGDFTGLVNRDEVTWRVSGKLVWSPYDQLSLAGLLGHDRFASENDEFDAERTQVGIITTLHY